MTASNHQTESESTALSYISYLTAEPMMDAHFRMNDTGCVIIQPIDDEEDSKYIILRNRCNADTWDKLAELVSKHPNVIMG